MILINTTKSRTVQILGLCCKKVVFDKFNIEFRQADEQIIFTCREELK